ncbi:unnamed protein product [marine sediment metagenome]|uniref:Phage tail collar domain-containing protein n=1 Tax=marine sediment metagenome TaxID=412755 RepID=X1NL59_9ZZZZ
MGDFQNPFGTSILLPPDYMIGAIIIWDTSRGPVPASWQVCDGTNGTPDLRHRFVQGAANFGEVGDTGGSATHSHDFTGDGHNHEVRAAPPTGIAAGADFRPGTTVEAATGTTDSTNGEPPWYKLFYIQRLTL